jgi:hypothetical protein
LHHRFAALESTFNRCLAVLYASLLIPLLVEVIPETAGLVAETGFSFCWTLFVAHVVILGLVLRKMAWIGV